MKKYLSLFVVLILVGFVGINVAKAESGSGSTGSNRLPLPPMRQLDDKEKIKEFRDGMKDKRDEIKADWEAKREEMKAKIDALREEAKAKMDALKESVKTEKDAAKLKIKELRITGRENALGRFDGVISRLTALKDKINEHITKLEVKGVNVDDAKKFMATAQEKLDAADAKTAEMNALLATSIDQLSAENKAKLKTLAEETRTLFKEAREALKNAVKSLKDAIKAKREAEKTSDDENKGDDDSQETTTSPETSN